MRIIILVIAASLALLSIDHQAMRSCEQIHSRDICLRALVR